MHLVSTSCADSKSTDLNIKSQPTENFKKKRTKHIPKNNDILSEQQDDTADLSVR